MNKIESTVKYEENNLQNEQEQNRFEYCETIVVDLVEQGLPDTFSPTTFMSKIAEKYGISTQEARTCLKLAISQLETQKETNQKPKEKLNSQSGYFYPSGYTTTTSAKQDGMDSLSSLGNYNRIMFEFKR